MERETSDCQWWGHCYGDTAVRRQMWDLRYSQRGKWPRFKGKPECICVYVCAFICMRMCYWRMNATAGVIQLFVLHVTQPQKALGLSQGRQAGRHHSGSEDGHELQKSYLQCQTICQLLQFYPFTRLNARLSQVKLRSQQSHCWLETYNNVIMVLWSQLNYKQHSCKCRAAQ